MVVSLGPGPQGQQLISDLDGVGVPALLLQGGGAIRHVDYDSKAGRIWFGTDVNTVGYAQVIP